MRDHKRPDSPSPPAERGPGGEVRWQTSPATWSLLQPLAREMRHQPTPAEALLWQRLRNGQLNGFRFRRQHVIGPYIVDFYCRAAQLVSEVDGEVHRGQVEADEIRDGELRMRGLRVLRFSNGEVLGNVEAVLEVIRAQTSPPSPLSASGEGESTPGLP